MKRVNLSKKRRGLSTIVGALLFVVLIVGMFGVIGVSLNSQTDLVTTSSDVSAKLLEQQREDYVLNSIQQAPLGFLEIDMTNLGQNSAEMFSVVMTNKTDTGEPTRTFDIPSETSFLLSGADSPTNIVSTLNLQMDIPGPGLQEEYDFKVFSSLGTPPKEATIVCDGDTLLCATLAPPTPPGTASLSATVFLDGPTGVNTKISTVIMFVQNTGTEPLEDVHPVDVCPSATFPSFNPSGGAFVNCIRTPTDTLAGNCGVNHDGNGICLAPGQFTIFKWDGEVQGTVDDVLTFCNQVIGEEEDGTAVGPTPVPSSCDELTIINPNDCGLPDCSGDDGNTNPLDERFITRPELFLTIPSPYGEGANSTTIIPPPTMRALWGANVVNPTETTMWIQKITITAFPPAANDNTNIVKGSESKPLVCNPQDISPGRGTVPSPLVDPDLKQADEAGSWSCPGQNTIMWFNYTDPIELPPLATFPFITKLEGHNPVTLNVESVLVDSTVYTTSGAFGKGNYQSTTYDKGMLANVYETTDPLNPLDIFSISTERSNIPSGSVQKFHIVLAELDLSDETYINATSKIIINVPSAFTNVDVIESETSNKIIKTPLGVEPSVVIHPDDTTQIIATINEDIGDQITEEAIVLTFEATAPTVATDKLMVMYTLANGPGSNNNSVGPLSEIILHVIPP